MSSVVWRKKKLATVIVGLFSLKENAPTKNIILVTNYQSSKETEKVPKSYGELHVSCKLECDDGLFEEVSIFVVWLGRFAPFAK